MRLRAEYPEIADQARALLDARHESHKARVENISRAAEQALEETNQDLQQDLDAAEKDYEAVDD
ncbi:MAG: hypothetical protein AAFY56_14755 [Pseudomonadota bacterium]